MADIPVEKLHELFEYRDGELYWKERPESDFATKRAWSAWHTKNAGKMVGCICNSVYNNSYKIIRFQRKNIRMHRVIFAMHHGYYPPMIDHIDGNGLNNKIENLRECDPRSNTHNTKIRSDNTSGYKNIVWRRTDNKWRVEIMKKGKRYHKDFEKDELGEAVKYAKELREKLHGDFARHE